MDELKSGYADLLDQKMDLQHQEHQLRVRDETITRLEKELGQHRQEQFAAGEITKSMESLKQSIADTVHQRFKTGKSVKKMMEVICAELEEKYDIEKIEVPSYLSRGLRDKSSRIVKTIKGMQKASPVKSYSQELA